MPENSNHYRLCCCLGSLDRRGINHFGVRINKYLGIVIFLVPTMHVLLKSIELKVRICNINLHNLLSINKYYVFIYTF